VARLDYANARIGARRALALGAPALRDLLTRPSLDARLELLRRSSWGPALAPDLARQPDPLGAAEASLQEEVRREALRVLEDVEGRRQRALLSGFLELAAARSVKAILRGIASGAPMDRIAALAVATPTLPVEAIRTIAAAPTVEEAVAVLVAMRSPLAPGLQAALPERAKRGLLPLEVAADRAVAARAIAASRGPREDARILRRHVRDVIDVRNAETLLVLSGAGTKAAQDLFVKGGRRILEPEFLRLAGTRGDALRAGLAAAFPGADAALARPWSADVALDAALIGPLRREARLRPLSLAVPLVHLLERRAEARRVAVVLRGAEFGLPPEEMLDLVEA
jgi:V/A-type H+-transporting ATPase subunit C